MRRMFAAVLAGLVVGVVGGASAVAQQIEGVDVEASRIVKERVGTASNLAPINAISLSYRVSYADLDLKTRDGVAALDKRVSDAALAACKEISRLYPLAQPDDLSCAKKAAAEAAPKVSEVVAAATKK